MNYIELNWAFQVFWSIFVEIDWKLIFLFKINHIQLNWVFQCYEGFSQKLTENFSFSSKWTTLANKLSFSGVLMLFRGNLLKTSLFAQNEPYSAKLSFSIVLKVFRGNCLKTSLFAQMSHIQLNWAFQVFWSFFAGIDRKILFWFKWATQLFCKNASKQQKSLV